MWLLATLPKMPSVFLFFQIYHFKLLILIYSLDNKHSNKDLHRCGLYSHALYDVYYMIIICWFIGAENTAYKWI